MKEIKINLEDVEEPYERIILTSREEKKFLWEVLTDLVVYNDIEDEPLRVSSDNFSLTLEYHG